MGAATFCEQWGVKRDWNLNRIDAPHAIITPLVRLTRVSETLLVKSLLLKKYLATVNIQTQMAPNIKFKWSKIPSDRYLQLPNGKIATSPKIYLQISSCS